MNKNNTIELFGVKFSRFYYDEILDAIQFAIQNKKQFTICYANANTINISLSNKRFEKILSEFDIIHPDGIGIYLASKFLYGQKGFSSRFTGSDFYSHLISSATENNWSFFFFGDEDKTLKLINKNLPTIKIAGFCNGFNYDNNDLIVKINNSNPDILIVGLGSPKQEQWIVENKNNIHSKVIIAVGDGIKVFAGTKKRGPKIIQKIGLEWFVRFLYEPKRLWRRYFIGIPLFIFRIIQYKILGNSIEKNG